MRIATSLLLASLLIACATSTKTEDQGGKTMDSQQGATAYLTAQENILKPLVTASNLAWYEASVSGSDEDWTKSQAAEDAVNGFLADADRFARVRALRDGGEITDPVVRRQLEVIYLSMLGKQVDTSLLAQITAIGAELEKGFNTYRGEVAGKKLTTNEVEQILRGSTDSAELQAAWEAQKGVGAVVAPKLKELVKLRNQVAKQLGFRDYYALKLAERELEEEKLLALFDQLDTLTRAPFLAHKAEVDRRLAKRLKLKPEQLMPWHYQNPFFQEPPDVFDTGLDAIYKQADTLELCRRFYGSIGMEVDDIIQRSSLYEKEGKTPHAFAADIDREGDIRVLANIVPGQQWQSTMVHELGHAVYDKYIDHKLPWTLRKATHPLTTEGLAMMLDRLVGNPRWAEALGLIDAAQRDKITPEAEAFLAFAPLQFSRWTQVMLRFERELYRDPDQDLDTLWWDMVEKYQGLKRPPGREAPDYASKIHLVVAPVYYHNYMLGELFSAQVHETIAAQGGKPAGETIYFGDASVGQLIIDKVIRPGALYRWDELTRRVTGRELGPEAFARRFTGE